MNVISQLCFDRLRTSLQPATTTLKEFVLTQTRLNGQPFSLKGHEYQGKVLELLADPDIDLVITKPSQTGISEVIYRAMLGWASMIRGFSAAVVFPTKTMSNEVFATRVSPIIDDCAPLKALRNNDVDSNSVKMFLNNSIIYALGAATNSKSTVINRPIRTVIADELARCDLGIITALRSRQRHQIHKSSVYFSTPLFENADIDAELQKCGVIWAQILCCRHCGHYFFPDFYKHVRLPGFDDDIKQLKQEHIDELHLSLDDGYLECPSCKQEAPFEYTDFEWVDVAETPKRPKVGLKLGAFCMPAFVKVPDMLKDYVAYEDKIEFDQQVLAKPAAKSDTAMDTSMICFEKGESGPINVWGLDFGKICTLFIASVSSEQIFIHTRLRIPLKGIRETVAKEVSTYNCIAGVVDFLPYSDIATEFVNSYNNCWAAQYIDPSIPIPELFKLKVHEDSDFGNVRQIQINKNLFFDTYANELMNQRIVFKEGEDKKFIREQHETMRRIRNPKFVEHRFHWVKSQGNKTQDHAHHTGIYTMAAARLMVKSSASSLPLSIMLSSFKLKKQL